MNGLLSFLLAGAMAVSAVDEQAPKAKIEVSGQVYMPDGKSSGASQRIEAGAEPVVLYVYTGQTLCEARTVSTQKPVVAGNGWRLELGPASSGAPNTPKGAFSIKATWQRLWEGGKPLTNGAKNTQTIQLQPGASVPLDTIDGSARRAAREAITRMKNWSNGDPIPEEIKRDQEVERLSQVPEKVRNQIKAMRSSGLAGDHPNVIAAMQEFAESEVLLTVRIRTLAEYLAQNPSSAPSTAVPSDGCAALSMNLQLQSSETTPASPVFEIDYWLVHRDPAGKETTQHQVVRTRAPNGADFIFDDIKINTERGPVTVEVWGGTGSPMGPYADKSVGLNVGVHRRFVTTSAAFGWKTKEGETGFGATFNGDEVLSFQLPPVNDDGALVGHRFSLRIKMRVLP